MFRKNCLLILAAAVIISGSFAVRAQSAPVTGRVELEKADKSVTPVAGALVEVYRTDIKQGFPSAKTDKKGVFNFAGLALVGTYSFSISAPGCSPAILPNIKAGADNLVITLNEGNGKKFTEDEVRKGVAGDTKSTGIAPAQLTAEQKKEQAAYESNKKAIEEKNAKALKSNEVVALVLKEGNEAYTAKNYDLAIAKYSEGIEAEPNFVGSTPVLLDNRGAAYTGRAVETYNKNAKATEATVKIEAFGKVKKDFADSGSSYSRSWEIMKNAAAADIVDPKTNDANKLVALRGIKETLRLAVLTEQVDPTLIEIAKVMVPEYVNIETEAAKKAEAKLIFADLYRVSGDFDNAILSYKAILETTPDELFALAGAGLSLVNVGYINNDKAKLQEGANYLQKYASAAPEGHKYKVDALGLIETLKKDQNVAPQKVTTTKKKP